MQYKVAAALLMAGLLAAAIPAGSAGPLDAVDAALIAGDYATVLKLAQPLAESGDPDAQFVMGDLYSVGDGVPQDSTEAVRWYRLAAQQGNLAAQHALCQSFARGIGVSQDDASAYYWCSLAASLSGGASRDGYMQERDELGEKLSAEQRAEVATLVAAWKPNTPNSAPDIRLVAKGLPPKPPLVWPERVRALFGVWSADCSQVPMVIISAHDDRVTTVVFIGNKTAAGEVDTVAEPSRMDVLDDPTVRHFEIAPRDGALQLRYIGGNDGQSGLVAAGAPLTAGGDPATLKLCHALPK